MCQWVGVWAQPLLWQRHCIDASLLVVTRLEANATRRAKVCQEGAVWTLIVLTIIMAIA